MRKLDAALKIIGWAIPWLCTAMMVWMMLDAQYDRGFRRGAFLTANLAGCMRDDTGSASCRKLVAEFKARSK